MPNEKAKASEKARRLAIFGELGRELTLKALSEFQRDPVGRDLPARLRAL